VHRQPT